jgi:signal transduction histidine kinase
MSGIRSTVGLLLLLLAALILFVGSVHEARLQRDAVARALSSQATLLANSLGPGLVAASNAARELDEIVGWKLLDNARLLSILRSRSAADDGEIDRIAEANGLDSVVFYDASGTVVSAHGELPPPSLSGAVDEILDGTAEELILGSTLEDGVEHIGAAVALREGGAVLVRSHGSTARTFARRLGVHNLLESLVDSQGLPYLEYHEEPAGTSIASSWNGMPVPPPLDEPEALQSFDGHPVFEVEVPLEAPAGISAHLRVGLDGEPLESAAAAAMRRILIMAIVLTGLALAGIATAWISRARSLERERATRKLAEAETARRRSERLAAAGALTAGLAHEVRSPMNAIGLASQRLERKAAAGEQREIAGQIRQEIFRLEGILREFLELANPSIRTPEIVDLAELGTEVADLLRHESEAQEIVLHPVEGRALTLVDREALRRALINLLRNAIQASSPGGEVSMRAWQTGSRSFLEMADRGPGIDPDLLGRIFDPFVTGRDAGTGLGLSIVKRVVEEHEGSVELRNRASGGAVATVELPAAPEVSA